MTVDISESMQSQALAGIYWARERFETSLDYSEASLHDVERILQQLRDRLPKASFSNLISRYSKRQEILEIAIVWGSYIGEVIRRHCHASWKVSQQTRKGIPVYPLQVHEITTFPVEEVFHWLTNPSSNGIWQYYLTVTQPLSSEPTQDLGSRN